MFAGLYMWIECGIVDCFHKAPTPPPSSLLLKTGIISCATYRVPRTKKEIPRAVQPGDSLSMSWLEWGYQHPREEE